MRYSLAVVAAVLIIAAIVTSPSGSAAIDPGSPQYANRMLSDFSTPTVAPGHTVEFAFTITNPYGPSRTMTDIEVTVGIYRYATQEAEVNVTPSFEHPPLMEDGTTESVTSVRDLFTNGSERIELPIHTTSKTPHGSIFSQATYFVRTKVTFHFSDNSTPIILQSRGWFTDQEWQGIVSFSSGDNIVNRTYLKSLGVDGLIPDSSFGIRQPIPIWPLGVIAFACVGTAFLAFYYYVLENPGRYPRLEQRFYYLRGKMGQLRSKLKNGR